jgi:signal transduction histidine kinase
MTPSLRPTWIARLHGLSLRRKLVLATVGTSLLTIILVSVALFAHQAIQLREQFRADHLALARLVADYCAAPVSFNDQRGQEDALAVLQSRRELVGAELRDTQGHVLARIGTPLATLPMPPAPASSGQFASWRLSVSQPLAVGAEHLGDLLVVFTFEPRFHAALRNFVPILAAVTIGALLFLVPAIWLLGGVLLSGLDRLGGSVAQIAETGDYAIRATPGPADEVGRLVDAFNSMLDRLHQANRDLQASNTALSREIGERKRLERALVDSSRLAGMAEVATGILHNVGNVLNSVNISTNLVRDELASNLHHDLLQRTAELLRTHGADAPRFLAEDPRGQRVPALLVEIAQGLALSRANLARELGSLSENVEHIKQIVAVQQSYARSGGVVQSFDPTELFQDVLRVVHPSIQNHHVQIHREFPDERPLLHTDRHLALQILVNLVQNAVTAVKPRPRDDRHVTLRLLLLDSNLHFIVVDNGVGIAPADRHRLFQHGFTTRKDGHGFGLHSGALAAANLGGALQVMSDGLDRGATFTLVLPLAPVATARP